MRSGHEGRQREVDGGEDSRPVRREHERRQCEVISSKDSVHWSGVTTV